ncbi:MAG: hypothetical protein ACOC8E_08415 [Planctomycetota bacterium]
MLRRAISIALLTAVGAAAMTGCAAPSSFTGYLENRRQDLIDVAHVEGGALNFGAVTYAGPLLVGVDYATGVRSREQSSTVQFGLGGPRYAARKGLCAGLLFPASYWNEDEGLVGEPPKRRPSGFSAGLQLGIFLGLGFEVDLLEAIDLVGGLVCIDFLEDDPHLAAEEEEEEPEAQTAPGAGPDDASTGAGRPAPTPPAAPSSSALLVLSDRRAAQPMPRPLPRP